MLSRDRMKCRLCWYEASVTAGTMIEGTHISLMLWFRAAWWMVNQKTGMSARNLQHMLGIGSYRTAWKMLHTLRSAARIVARVKLKNKVEVGLHCFDQGTACSQLDCGSCVVAIIVEGDEKGLKGIRMRRLQAQSANEIIPYIQSAVEKGSMVHTDESLHYAGLSALGYRHMPTAVRNLKAEDRQKKFARVQLTATLVKRWIDGTYHGRYDERYIDRYLAEFAFRFNWRKASHPGELFVSLLRVLATEEKVPL